MAADIKENGVYGTVGVLTTAVGTQITAHGTLLDGVNDATTISAMDVALEALDYAAYDNLSAAKQVQVAEAFLTVFPTVKDATTGVVSRVEYTSVTAIKSDVDKAISATN